MRKYFPCLIRRQSSYVVLLHVFCELVCFAFNKTSQARLSHGDQDTEDCFLSVISSIVKVVQYEKKCVLFVLDGTAVIYAEQNYVFLFVGLLQYRKTEQVLNVISQVISFSFQSNIKTPAIFRSWGVKVELNKN